MVRFSDTQLSFRLAHTIPAPLGSKGRREMKCSTSKALIFSRSLACSFDSPFRAAGRNSHIFNMVEIVAQNST